VRAELTETSNATRAAMAAWRKALASGEVSLADALRERPECYSEWAVLDFLRLGRRWGRRHVASLNAHAIACGVNLAESMGGASEETIDFAVKACTGRAGAQGFAKTFRRQMEAYKTEGQRRAERDTKRLRDAITAHQRAMRDPQLDADVVEADAKLWKAAE
jgi:hypothetical protein